MPLVYYFGYNSPKENLELYMKYIDILAENVRERMERDLDTKSSGIVINTCGWIESGSQELILHICKAFLVDVILVMGHDKLYSSLVSGVSNQGITVVKLPTSGGIVRRESTTRRRLRKSATKEYFYGKQHISLLSFSPARMDIKLNTIKLYRAGGYQLSEGMRYLDEDDNKHTSTELVSIPPTMELVNSVLGVIHPIDEDKYGSEETDPTTEMLMKSNITGFIVVVQLNTEQNIMTVLSPCPGSLPSKYLLVGAIKWTEK